MNNSIYQNNSNNNINGNTSNETYKTLANAISESCEAIRCISLEPNFDSAKILYDSFYKLHASALELQKNQMDIQIPFDLLDCIDRGRNPEEWYDALLKDRSESKVDNIVKRDLVSEMRQSLEEGLTEIENEINNQNIGFSTMDTS